jgi:hypothetical protein
MINFAQARKIAAQETAYRGLSGMKTNTPGAYFFFQMTEGGRLVIDDRCLDQACRQALEKHFEPDLAVEINHIRDLTQPRFVTPKNRQNGYTLNSGEKASPVKIWVLSYDDWCIPLIYGGIRAGNFTNNEALTRYDKLFAASHHDKIAARASVARFPFLLY